MKKHLAAILCLAALAVSLGGCSKCGPFWDQGPRTCHSDSTR